MNWEQVNKKGYFVLRTQIDPALREQALNETFLPYGFNPELSFHSTILHPYFATKINYETPELHKSPKYLSDVAASILSQIETHKNRLHTTDMLKYVPGKVDPVGPYKFHYDRFQRLDYMFFVYFSKKSPIIGRELLVGTEINYDTIQIEDGMCIVMKANDPEILHKVLPLREDNEVVLLTNYVWL